MKLSAGKIINHLLTMGIKSGCHVHFERKLK